MAPPRGRKNGDGMKLLIFDFDGTLADTGAVILQTTAQTLARLKLPLPPEASLKKWIGLPLAEIFANACDTRDEELISEAVKIYRARFPENCGTVKLYPGVRQGLDKLRRAGMMLALASSRERNSLLSLTNLLGITNDFNVIAGEQDVIRHKPEPDIVNFVLKATNITPDCAMFIGDTVFDIAAGRAAGVKTCGVTYGNHKRERLLAAGADYVINEFPGLLPLVNAA